MIQFDFRIFFRWVGSTTNQVGFQVLHHHLLFHHLSYAMNCWVTWLVSPSWWCIDGHHPPVPPGGSGRPGLIWGHKSHKVDAMRHGFHRFVEDMFLGKEYHFVVECPGMLDFCICLPYLGCDLFPFNRKVVCCSIPHSLWLQGKNGLKASEFVISFLNHWMTFI